MAVHYTSLEGVNLQNTWLTIGSFDGVHIGHQHLIHELNKKAHLAAGKSVILTFHPHPSVVLRGRRGAFYLTTVSERLALLDEMNVDIVVVHPFTYEISQSSAEDFVSNLILHLHFRQLWVGHDFALGKGREGNVDYLKKLGEKYNYRVQVVEPITSDGAIVSSSQIRNLLEAGLVKEASLYLGRPYKVSGAVIHGDGRGKRIGIPTANLETGAEKLVPGAGVYACRVQVGEKFWAGAINIGTRPTFESIDKLSHVEAHILDLSDDLYGEVISIEFIARLRGEVRFNSVDELIAQIHQDIQMTRELVEVPESK